MTDIENNMTASAEAEKVLRAKINLETAEINWHDLQVFHAKGHVIHINESLDIVDVAYQLSIDNKVLLEKWQTENVVAAVTDEQALSWYENKTDLWAVVVRPWVLVQNR